MPRDEWQSSDPQSRSSRWARQRGQREHGWRGREFRGGEGAGQGVGYGEEWSQAGRQGRGAGGQERGWLGRSLGYDQDFYGGRRWEGGGFGRRGGYRGFGRESSYGEEFPSTRGQAGAWRGRSMRHRPWSSERGEAYGGYGGYGAERFGGGYGEEFRERGRQGFGGGRERFGWRGRSRTRSSRYGEEFGW